MDRKSSRLERFIQWGRANANQDARKYVSRAVRGDRIATAELANRLTHDERVSFTLEMYRVKVPLFLYRHFLRIAWVRSWVRLVAAVGFNAVIEMFRYADFDLPSHIGATVKAYRGSSGLTAFQSACGMSWSLSRDVACHFAYASPIGVPREPLVIEAHIPREQILMYTRYGSFNEITVEPILSNPAIEFRVSLPAEDWFEGYKSYTTRRQREQGREPLPFKKLEEFA
jgi:hypothetical protein